MMRWLALCVVLFACDGGVGNELPSLEQRRELAREVCPRVVRPFLYRVERDGKTSYLFGTRHLGVGLDQLPQSTRDTLFTQKQLVFETSGDEKPDFSGPQVRSVLAPADWERYRAIAGDRLADTVGQKSVIIANVALIAKYEDTQHLLDKEIRTHAQHLHLPTRGLESETFQIGVLKELMTPRMLRTLLDVGSSNALRLATMKSLGDYCIGREHPDFGPESAIPFVAEGYSLAEIDRYQDTLLYSRNRAWLPQLEQLFGEGNVAVVVGAAHLSGDRSVVGLLRARGYTITRVEP